MKRAFSLTMALLLCLALCACGTQTTTTPANQQVNKSEVTTTKPAEDVKAKVTTANGTEYLTAKELCDINSSNAIRFDNTYWSASVTVTGTVNRIEGPISINGTYYNWALYVEGGQADWFIGDDQYNTSMVSKDVLAELNIGDSVEITGEIVGASMGQCNISNGMIFVVKK